MRHARCASFTFPASPPHGPRAGRVRRLWCVALIGFTIGLPAVAEDLDEVGAPRQLRWVLGVSAQRAPEYAGSGKSDLKLRPLWALRYGRYRLSTSRANAVLGFGADAPGPGASADLIAGDRFKFGAALRIDGGRKSSDTPAFAGLPDVRRTVRGRVYASYVLNKHWSLGASLSQDLLGRQGGAQFSTDIGYGDRLGAHSEWSVGFGSSFQDRRHAQSYFGVSAPSAQRTGLSAFEAQGGMQDLHLGIGLTTALTPHWIAFGSAGWAVLHGSAAASPLTRDRSNGSVSVGIAYRSL